MSTAKVWLRPGAGRHKIRVESINSAELVESNLRQPGITCTDPTPVGDGSFYVFFATCPEGMPESRFEQLVKEIPGVELMLDPA